MKLNKLLVAALAAMTLASCNKDDENYQGNEDLNASISITIPRITTYATDINAVADETVFATADVFIFDGSTLETHKNLDATLDFQLNGTHEYESTTKIQTTTGSKEVYVGLNLPASIVSTIRTSGIKAGLAQATQITVADLVDDGTGNKGFAMFSTAGVPGNFVEDSDPAASTANKVSVAVERLVAKVTVQEGSTLTTAVTGGTISDLKFAMRNSNKQIFASQQKNGTVVIDPNWADGSYVASDFESFTDYVDICKQADASDITKFENKYAPENTSEKHATQESTYASLQAVFAPSQFVDGSGAPKTPSIWTAAGDDFWTIVLADGTINYFEDETEADTYRTANPGAAKNKYENGYCYYNMFLNPNGGYNTIRNNYYKLTINSIKGLGNPNPKDGGDTANPVPTATNIDVSIDIAAWTMVPDGYDL